MSPRSQLEVGAGTMSHPPAPRPPGEQKDLENIIAKMLEVWDRMPPGGRMEIFLEKRRGNGRPASRIMESHYPLEDSAA